MITATLTVRLLRDFADPALRPEEWEKLLSRSQTDSVFLTWQWQSAWWECFGRGELLLIAVERDGEVIALAPLFTEAGMIYFVGSGGSDYLDFIGDISEPEILDLLLLRARDSVPGFIGFVFYHVPETSATGQQLQEAAGRLGLKIFEEGQLSAPVLDLATERELALAAPNKKSLVRHERALRREGELSIAHFRNGEEILPHLEVFFAQHRERWAATGTPSLFCDERQRRFYRRLAQVASDTGWLRFTRLDWAGRPVAFHFGVCYRGSYLWYKPSFAIDLARHSPGEVLLRQLLLAALGENASRFDFGLGDEAFKSRFASRVNRLRNWGVYSSEALEAQAS